MRILLTGTNAPQCGSTRVPLKYATGCQALVDTLRSLGHEVDQRGVYPGEQKLHLYDRVICYLAPFNALTAQWTFGVLWLLRARPDAMLALDDWQTRQIITGARSLNRDHRRLYREVLNRKGRDNLTPGIRGAIEAALAELAETELWPRRLIAPVFPWGDVFKLGLAAASYHGFDPTHYWRGHYDEAVKPWRTGDRAREWVSASLLSKQDWLDRLKPSWEVFRLGNKKQGQPRLREDAVVAAYCQRWGVLSAPHSHAGSGWWRARYVFAADAGAVLYGDPRETRAFGDDYGRLTLAEIEQLKPTQLYSLAQAQAEQLYSCTWTHEQLRDWAAELLK